MSDKSLLHQGLSESEFYGDLVYKSKKIDGTNNFPTQFGKIISHYKIKFLNVKFILLRIPTIYFT